MGGGGVAVGGKRGLHYVVVFYLLRLRVTSNLRGRGCLIYDVTLWIQWILNTLMMNHHNVVFLFFVPRVNHLQPGYLRLTLVVT